MSIEKKLQRYMNFSDKDRSCRGKMAFSDKKFASNAAKAANGRAGKKVNIKAYKCRYCPFWHIGGSVHLGRMLEERVPCPKGCGVQVREKRLSHHLAKCDGTPYAMKRHRMEAQADEAYQDVETSDPSQYDLEQDLG